MNNKFLGNSKKLAFPNYRPYLTVFMKNSEITSMPIEDNKIK